MGSWITKREINRYHKLVDLELHGTITPKQRAELKALVRFFDGDPAPVEPPEKLSVDEVLAKAREVLRKHGVAVPSPSKKP